TGRAVVPRRWACLRPGRPPRAGRQRQTAPEPPMRPCPVLGVRSVRRAGRYANPVGRVAALGGQRTRSTSEERTVCGPSRWGRPRSTLMPGATPCTALRFTTAPVTTGTQHLRRDGRGTGCGAVSSTECSSAVVVVHRAESVPCCFPQEHPFFHGRPLVRVAGRN